MSKIKIKQENQFVRMELTAKGEAIQPYKVTLSVNFTKGTWTITPSDKLAEVLFTFRDTKNVEAGVIVTQLIQEATLLAKQLIDRNDKEEKEADNG